MRVNLKFVKQQRKDRLWSQEQLAEITNLSPRTIQRIESTGNASDESIKSLVAAFECEVEQLVLSENYESDVSYSNTQLGLYILLVTSITWLLIASPIWFSLTSASESKAEAMYWTLAIVTATTLIISILFFSLTVKVNNKEIIWYFGPVFWRKSLPVTDVVECKVVRNSVLYGFGIRDIGAGWLYNVSGLLAVEILLKSGSVIRLGTNEPEFLKNAIESASIHSTD